MKTSLLKILLSCAAAACGLLPIAATSSAREVINLNRGWAFYAGADTASAPVKVNLPHDYQISQPWIAPEADEKGDAGNAVANIASRLSARGFKEPTKGLYRKNLFVPEEWRGLNIALDFEGILLVGDVYLNGKRVGGTDYGYLGFAADVTKALRYGEDNVIEVVADAGKPENSRWYTGAGLYRDVNLVLTDPTLRFARHPFKITTPEITEDAAVVALQAEVTCASKSRSPFSVTTEILSPEGKKVAGAVAEIKRRHASEEYLLDTLLIPAPQLWDCDSPNLYTAVFTLRDKEGNLTDSLSQRFGIRTVEYTADRGLLLNGKKVYLKGIANHHTLGALGAAAHPDAMRKRLGRLKEWGFNHVRTSHNPYSESFLDLCDEMGILVVDELYDKWLTKYAGGRRDWMALWPEDIPEWMRRDRNHPSVIMWSLGNELQTLWDIPYHDGGVTPYRMQRGLTKRFDTTRPLTVAMHPRGRHPLTDSLPAPLASETDIASYNYRFMYFPGDARRFPDMKFYLSEASTSRIPASWFGPDREKTIGLAYWGAIDYLGESQGWPAKGWDKGVFDISLQPKPQAWLVRSIFREDEPTVHIAVVESEDNTVWNDVMVGTGSLTDHWNRRPGSKLRIFTYTNGDEVELWVNGRSFGRRPNPVDDPENRNTILWDSIPYSPGYVEAIAFRDGRKVAAHRVETAGKAVRLVAELDEDSAAAQSAVAAPGGRLHHINIRAVDSKGRTVPVENRELTFRLEGGGEDDGIIGLINGDMTTDELFTPSSPRSGSHRLHRGRAVAILRSFADTDDSAGATGATEPHRNRNMTLTLTVSAPGLRPAVLHVKLLICHD